MSKQYKIDNHINKIFIIKTNYILIIDKKKEFIT